MSTSRTYHHGDLRAALLETTRALLADRGMEGLSLRAVSRRAGVSHAAAYNHFRDKGALLAAVVAAAFERLAVELQAARAAANQPLDALVAVGLAYVRFAYRNPADFKIMFRPELCAQFGSDPIATNDAYGVLVASVIDAQAAGAVRAGPVQPLVLAAWSMVHGLSSLIVDGPDRDLAPSLTVAESLAGMCIEVLANGALSRTP